MGVVSAQGQGTSFHIYWPVADAEQTGAKPNAPVGRNLNGMPIIIVDDDAQVAEVIASYLEAHGAEVAQCIAPQDAIDAIAETPEFWAALITDYDMSDINGGELAEKVGRIAPDLPIVVVTALARRLTDPRLTTSQVRAILPKPVDLDHLLGMLAELDVKKPKGGS
jgi:CheY-like chemotaxis protein